MRLEKARAIETAKTTEAAISTTRTNVLRKSRAASRLALEATRSASGELDFAASRAETIADEAFRAAERAEVLAKTHAHAAWVYANALEKGYTGMDNGKKNISEARKALEKARKAEEAEEDLLAQVASENVYDIFNHQG